MGMPIFEFKCVKCGHVMEVLQKSLAAETPTCEKCGGADLKKLLSGFAVGKTSAAPACDSCFDGPACGGGVKAALEIAQAAYRLLRALDPVHGEFDLLAHFSPLI
jgi:putative FmdB family regulatory protein